MPHLPLVDAMQKARSYSLLRKTCSDGDARTDSGRLFQTDAAAAGKVRSPMVARTVRGARRVQYWSNGTLNAFDV